MVVTTAVDLKLPGGFMSESDSRASRRPFPHQKVYGSGAHPWRWAGAARREPLPATIRPARGEPALPLWPRPAGSRFRGFCARPTPVVRRHTGTDRPDLPQPIWKNPDRRLTVCPIRLPRLRWGVRGLYGLCTVCVRFLYGSVRCFVGDCTVFWLPALRERTL